MRCKEAIARPVLLEGGDDAGEREQALRRALTSRPIVFEGRAQPAVTGPCGDGDREKEARGGRSSAVRCSAGCPGSLRPAAGLRGRPRLPEPPAREARVHAQRETRLGRRGARRARETARLALRGQGRIADSRRPHHAGQLRPPRPAHRPGARERLRLGDRSAPPDSRRARARSASTTAWSPSARSASSSRGSDSSFPTARASISARCPGPISLAPPAFEDRVHRDYVRIFGGAVLLSAISAGAPDLAGNLCQRQPDHRHAAICARSSRPRSARTSASSAPRWRGAT